MKSIVLMILLTILTTSCGGYVSAELINTAQKKCKPNGGLYRVKTYNCIAPRNCLIFICKNELSDTIVGKSL